MLTFDFEWFSSEVHCELESKQFQISDIFEFTNSDVTSFILDNYLIIFLTTLRLVET